MRHEGLIVESKLTSKGMSLDTEMADEELVMEAEMTDEGMSL